MSAINIANYKGREQAYIKHALLGSYLSELGFRVGRGWESLLYIDTHAGPWKESADDLSDTSFSIGVDTLRRVYLGLRDKHKHEIKARAFLNEPNNSEKDGYPFDRLSDYAKKSCREGLEVIPNNEEFESATDKILEFIKNSPRSFRFILLDPKGWDSIPMKSIAAITNDRSSEVLINLMTKDLRRFLEQEDRAASYERLFGSGEVLERLQGLDKGERVDALVREYCKCLKQHCQFDHVSSCAVVDPDKSDVKYFLVFATNHHRGIEVFKNAETQANRLQETIKLEKQEVRKAVALGSDSLFCITDFSQTSYMMKLREKYRSKAEQKMFDLLRSGQPVPYRDVFCETMAFPLFGKEDLHNLIQKSQNVALVLDKGKTPNRKTPSCDSADYLVLRERAP